MCEESQVPILLAVSPTVTLKVSGKRAEVDIVPWRVYSSSLQVVAPAAGIEPLINMPIGESTYEQVVLSSCSPHQSYFLVNTSLGKFKSSSKGAVQGYAALREDQTM